MCVLAPDKRACLRTRAEGPLAWLGNLRATQSGCMTTARLSFELLGMAALACGRPGVIRGGRNGQQQWNNNQTLAP